MKDTTAALLNKSTVEGQIPAQNLSELRKPIPIERVDFRIQSISKNGYATILAYKDARVDMDVLDNVLGPGFWQRKHDIIGDELYCSVGIYNQELQQWCWVQDVGTESNTEKEKGRASDSFKRACFNLGIGRELYSYPLILVQLKPGEFEEDTKTHKMRATYDLHLRDWSWMITWKDDPETGKLEVGTLIAHDDKGLERFRYPRFANNKPAPKSPSHEGAAAKAEETVRDRTTPDYSEEPTKKAVEKPWFNDFEARRDEMFDMLEDGRYKDAQHIIDDLKKKYKVSKTVEDKIRNLEKPY